MRQQAWCQCFQGHQTYTDNTNCCPEMTWIGMTVHDLQQTDLMFSCSHISTSKHSRTELSGLQEKGAALTAEGSRLTEPEASNSHYPSASIYPKNNISVTLFAFLQAEKKLKMQSNGGKLLHSLWWCLNHWELLWVRPALSTLWLRR